ncbi:MAG: hypothetical protein NZ902_06460 [Acidilobaceae archaeon]|nr:hypothetical protein [Acidilobaceae archaeon]
MVKLFKDFEKYASKFLKIRNKEGVVVNFNLLPAQKKVYEVVKSKMEAGEPVRVIVLKSRQQGISSLCVAMAFWKSVTTRNYNSVLIAHNRETSERLLEIAGFMYDELPDAVRPMRRYRSKSEILFENPSEKERTFNPGLRSRIEVKTAGYSVSGRGLTIHYLHCSEICSYENPSELLASLLPAVPLHAGTFVFLESTGSMTPGGRWFRELWEASKEGDTPFTPVFIPWFESPEYVLKGKMAKAYLEEPLDPEEVELVKEFGLTKEQIAWRRYKIMELPGGVREFNREFPTTDKDIWFGVGAPFIEYDAARALRAGVKPPIARFRVNERGIFPSEEGNFEVWELPQEGVFYTVGVDTSSGFGNSRSCVQVVRLDDDMRATQVAAYREAIDYVALADVVLHIARMYKDAMVSVEINGGGLATQQIIIDKGYSRLFRWRYFGHMYGDIPSKKVGWETNVASKPILMQHFKYVLERGLLSVPCGKTVDEIVALIEDGRGGGEAPPGENDDMAMALAIAAYTAFLERKGLARMYVPVNLEEKTETSGFTLADLLPGSTLFPGSGVW